MIPLHELTSYLASYLRLAEVPDDPNAVNGLQVEATTHVTRIACAVDAAEASIEAALEKKADLLLVHHGLLWGGNRPLSGPHGRKLRRCFTAGLSVYSAHLPLDVHPEVGNNAGLLGALGLKAEGAFANWKGTDIGLTASCDLSLDELVATLSAQVGPIHRTGAGPSRIRRLGVITGSGGSYVSAAAKLGLDALVTGEGPAHTAIEAEERGVHLLFGGHYRTEVFGVKALGAHLGAKFGLPFEFLPHDTGL